MSMEEGLEAQRKQKIRNLQLKTVCLENEEYIQELHVSDHSQTQKAKLDAAHEKAFKLIQNVEQGTRWNLIQAYDVNKLLKACGLTLNSKELCQPTDQPQFMDVIALRKTLNELKQHRNKNRTVSFGELIDTAIRRFDECEQQLRRSQIDATGLAAVPVECIKALEDFMNVPGAHLALAGTDERIQEQWKLIERANEVQNIALHDGEMSVAEEQYYTKISLLEMLFELVQNKFSLLDQTKEETRAFSKVQVVKTKTDQLAEIHERERGTLRTRATQDLQRVMDALRTADAQDADLMRKFVEDKQASDAALRQNLTQQDECWRKIQDLERQLQKLGTERFEEVKRRLEDLDREERRKVEYQQFLEVAGAHKRALELTLYNCDVALNVLDASKELATNGVKLMLERHDKSLTEIEDMRLTVHKELLEVFRQLYLTLGQLRYKKEKKMDDLDQQIRTTHIQLEFCIETFDPNAKKHSNSKKELYALRAICEEELDMIKDKMDRLMDQMKPTEEALTAAGIEFLHPARELVENTLHRRSKIVEYRVQFSQGEEERIASEREEIKQRIVQRAQSPTRATSPKQIQDRPTVRPSPPPTLPSLSPRTWPRQAF